MTCGHDKSFKERCIECELVLVREGLAWSERKASEYRDAVLRLEAELAPTNPQPNFAKSSLATGAINEPQAAAWQPIETAPRDGSRILLFQHGRGAFEGWWKNDWPVIEQYWMDDADSEPSPTHWQPTLALPRPLSRTGES